MVNPFQSLGCLKLMAAVGHERRQLAIYLNHAYKYGNFYLVFVECLAIENLQKNKTMFFFRNFFVCSQSNDHHY